jgi:hypothetical protein
MTFTPLRQNTTFRSGVTEKMIEFILATPNFSIKEQQEVLSHV